ncbi:MAG: DUF4412 domain-containing protein [Bacteroidia bacterium]|nr:DUF4412 domain-containing protein [Bacteroidia bacterium]
MKKIFFILVQILFVISASSAQDAYYMEYISLVGSGSTTVSSKYKIWNSNSGSRVEMDMEIPGMGAHNTIVINPIDKPNISYLIDEQNKSYTEISNNDVDNNDDFGTVEIVGKEKVNGYNCVHARIKSKGPTIEMWTTKDIPFYKEIANKNWNQGSKKAIENAFKNKEVEGVMVKMKGSEQGATYVMELVKIEKKNIPGSMFKVPANYTKTASFDPSKMQNMSDEDRQKMLEEMMKQYQIKDENED